MTLKNLHTKTNFFATIFFLMILTACSPFAYSPPSTSSEPEVTTSNTDSPKTQPAPTVTRIIYPTNTPTTAPESLPVYTLKAGDYYFSREGQQAFIFSRNISGFEQKHYDAFLDWSQAGGSTFVRLPVDSLGMGYTNQGTIDEAWARQWELIFDITERDRLYFIPVFSTWYDWNSGSGYSTWSSNPLNSALGGPAKKPAELFQKDSDTQRLWLQWMQSLVQRWQGRKNILAWEIFSEINLASGATEATAINFTNRAVALIRTADPAHRPITASLAETGTWPNYYRKAEIDFINIHPYPPSAQLDRMVISEVRKALKNFHKPVLIGESGLSAVIPVDGAGKITIAENAPLGVKHAIWAGVVSGAFNGRSLWWEDSIAIAFPDLGMPFIQKYANAELPAVNFVTDVDFTDFKPLSSTYTYGVWGAAIGNEKSVIGWYRDATCEPPNWNLKPVISKQTVTITVPGSVAEWQVKFYDPNTGKELGEPISVKRKGTTIKITLPDFIDSVAFKMFAQ
jgi:hypothetical protein